MKVKKEGAKWQRCVVHFCRNVFKAAPISKIMEEP